jgi:hypothetical protein
MQRMVCGKPLPAREFFEHPGLKNWAGLPLFDHPVNMGR